MRSYVVPLAEAGELPVEGEADLRYRGQSFELPVSLAEPDLAEAFHRAHEERFGHAFRERAVELVAVRTAVVSPGPELRLPAGERLEVVGPLRVELAGATCWVPASWAGQTDEHGTLVLERRTDGAPS